MKIGTKDELSTLKILKILKILNLFNLLGAAMFNRRWGKELYPSSGIFFSILHGEGHVNDSHRLPGSTGIYE